MSARKAGEILKTFLIPGRHPRESGSPEKDLLEIAI
jgi:hypothetical protein